MSYAATFEKGGQTVCLTPDEIANDDEIAYEISAKTKLTLLIYPQFEAWDFPEKETTVILIDVDTHTMEFYGRVTDVQDSMDSSGRYCRRVTCANEMDFLDDTRTAATLPINTYANAALTALIDAHNAKVGTNSPRSFAIGDISAVASKKLSAAVLFDYVTTLDALKRIFIDEFGAEIRTRHINGVNYFDAGKFGSTSQTVIKIGDNLQNIRATYSAADRIVTRLYPLGGVGYDGERLTIANAPGNTSAKIYIDNVEMIAKYGIHEGVYIVNELAPQSERSVETLSQRLYEIGLAAAEALSTPAVEITLSALDLAKLGLSGYNGFALGNTHLTIYPKLGVHHDLRIMGLKRKLASPQNTELTISTINKRRDKANASLSAKLAAIDKNTNNKIDSNSYTYTSVVNEHFDGVDKLEKITKNEFDQTTKDPKTAYFVDDGEKIDFYLGDEHINWGGGVVEYAAIVNGEGGWTPATTPISVFYDQGVPAYYGGAPARMVIQGYKMLFNVAFDDIEVSDVYSDLTLKDFASGALHDIHAWVIISQQTATTVTVKLKATIDGVDSGTNYYSVYSVTPAQMQGFTCGICMDFSGLEARPTGLAASYPYLARAYGAVLYQDASQRNHHIFLVGFLGGTILYPSAENPGTWRGVSSQPIIPILETAENEYHFDFGTTKRYEVEET
ncbi:MAG: phage tail protein [Clostridia bacterium]|nr:phage tail protein [Clostridia bacterium]